MRILRLFKSTELGKFLVPNLRLTYTLCVWLVGYIRRSETPIRPVAFLSLLSFGLQGSLAITLIVSSKLLSGEAVGLSGLPSLKIDDPLMGTILAVASISVIMTLSAVSTLLMNYRLRAIGRAIHTRSLKDLLEKLPTSSFLQDQSTQHLNRLLYQASLHMGIAVESLFQLIQPFLMLGFAVVTLLYLDPTLIFLLLVAVLPIVPLYLYQSQKLVSLSENFYGSSAGKFSQVFVSYLGMATNQNLMNARDSLDCCDSDRRYQQYLDDFDGIVLAGDRMTFTFAVYRPMVFAIVLIYLAISYSFESEGSLIFIPILFAVFYLSNAGLSLIANGTNLLRLLPQLKILYTAIIASDSVEEEWSISQEVGFSGIQPCFFEKKITNALLNSMTRAVMDRCNDSGDIVYLSSLFRAPDLTVKQVLTGGREEFWERVLHLLDEWDDGTLLGSLEDGAETPCSREALSNLSGQQCALFHLIPSALFLDGNIVLVEEAMLRKFSDSVLEAMLKIFSAGQTLLLCDGASKLDLYGQDCLLLRENWSVDIVSQETLKEAISAFENRARAREDSVQAESESVFV